VFKPGPAPKPPKTKEQKKQERLNRQKPKQCVVCGKQHVRQGKTCSDECCSAILSENAKNRGLGGNKNTRAHGWYQSPTAGRVWLESSYEYRVAKDLDDIGIAWTRPAYLPYVLNEQCKKYYADFYLVDQDVYLDPKNDFLITQDKSKIEAVSEQNHVKILILNKHQLSWSCIKQLIEN
jgi:predicted nucleic acid-binding Zn ribbon protein